MEIHLVNNKFKMHITMGQGMFHKEELLTETDFSRQY